MARQFEGKVALVTGASSGIGRACVRAFAREGARVIVADLSVTGGEETVRLVKAAGGDAAFVRCDVTQSAEVARMVEQTTQIYGRLDYACNNAGITGALALTADYPEDDWQRVIGVNLTGVWLCMKHEISAMLTHGGGSIVNISSILGAVGTMNASAYVAAKHGVVGLTKAAALEYATQGIRINAVQPGFITTPMIERVGIIEGTERYDMIAARHPMQRLGTPEEIAATVIWLCSDAASFVTGHAMRVDGGYVAQ